MLFWESDAAMPNRWELCLCSFCYVVVLCVRICSLVKTWTYGMRYYSYTYHVKWCKNLFLISFETYSYFYTMFVYFNRPSRSYRALSISTVIGRPVQHRTENPKVQEWVQQTKFNKPILINIHFKNRYTKQFTMNCYYSFFHSNILYSILFWHSLSLNSLQKKSYCRKKQ